MANYGNMSGSDFIDTYVKWIRNNMKSSQIDGYTAIITPFLDRHNDCIEIYVKQANNKIFLTDDGYIINDIESSGCDLSNKRRQDILNMLASSVGVHIEDRALVVEASPDTFAQKKHSLIQAMLSISDMLLLSRGNIMSIFYDEVADFFETNDIRYTPLVQFAGKSGLTHKFDFVIPNTRKKPERIIRALNDPSRTNAESTLFAWSDVKEARAVNAQMLVFLNDTDKNVSSSVKNAFLEYGIIPVPWSRRIEALPDLAA